jgi:hypothetical protein
MCGTIDPGSCIRWVLGFGVKTGYDMRAVISWLFFKSSCASPLSLPPRAVGACQSRHCSLEHHRPLRMPPHRPPFCCITISMVSPCRLLLARRLCLTSPVLTSQTALPSGHRWARHRAVRVWGDHTRAHPRRASRPRPLGRFNRWAGPVPWGLGLNEARHCSSIFPFSKSIIRLIFQKIVKIS